MSFIQPLFLLGLLAASLPFIVHFFNRRKAIRRPFPAMQLLMESNKKVARSVKVRQILLLALRVLAVVLLAFALAKPFLFSTKGLTAEERLPTAVVFVIDTSYSMGYDKWWENAATVFRNELARLRPWDETALVDTTDSSPASSRLSNDQSSIRRKFNALTFTETRGDIIRAIGRASDILSTTQLPNKRIVVISDFSQGNWAPTARGTLNMAVPIEFVSVRSNQEERPFNVAVTHLEYEQEGSHQDRVVALRATVHNYGDVDAKAMKIQLSVGDNVVAAGLVDIPAGGETTHLFRHRMESAGIQRATVSLVNADKLDIDNHRHISIFLRGHVRVLVVNGRPSSVPQNDEVFFLWHALNTGLHHETPIVPTVATVDGLDSRDLSSYDVVFLANVARLSQDAVHKISDFVHAGGGLFISLGSQVEPVFYNNYLSDILPRSLRDIKLLARRNDPDAPIKVTRFGQARRQHPVFRVFSLPGGATIQSAQVFSYMLLDPAVSDQETTVLLSYQDNAPALLERTVGQGKVMMLTTGIHREWTDFPIRTAYLPVLRRSMMYLSKRSTSGIQEQIDVGQPVVLDVAGLVQERVVVRTPSDNRLVLEPLSGEVSLIPGEIGFYDVWADKEPTAGDASSPGRNRLEQLAFAINVETKGSNLAEFPSSALSTLGQQLNSAPVSQESETVPAAPPADKRINLWPIILFAITVLLLLETVVGIRRSVLITIKNYFRRLVV